MAGRKPLPDDTPVFPKCGHSRLDPDNVYVHPRTGVKSCRTCNRAREQARTRKARMAQQQEDLLAEDYGGRTGKVYHQGLDYTPGFEGGSGVYIPPPYPPCGGDI